MTTNLINLDSAGNSILKLSKDNLLETARNLQSQEDPLTEFEMLKKLSFLIEMRMEMIKDSAKENFLEKFGGSKNEKENGFIIMIKEYADYDYSEIVKKMDSQIKKLQAKLKKQKEIEKKSGSAITGKVKFNTLSMELK